MKAAFLASIAALLLATGTAHARYFSDRACGDGWLAVEHIKHPHKDSEPTHTYAVIFRGLDVPQRIIFKRRGVALGTPYVDGKRCTPIANNEVYQKLKQKLEENRCFPPAPS
jgi:hypothetical protein